MKGENIAERLLDFALGILQVVSTLPGSPEGKHIARQLTRSGTAGGANYEEARAAESRNDFAHKVGIAAKEVGESVYWLRLAGRSGLCPRGETVEHLVGEGRQLVAILKSSARTAKRRSA